MIDKSFTHLYENWYYKKTNNEYIARQVGLNNVGITKEVKTFLVENFVENLLQNDCVNNYTISKEDLKIIGEKYGWIKECHKEVILNNIHKPITFYLLLHALETKDYCLSDFIIKKFNLTKQDSKSWEIKTLDGYDVEFKEIRYGKNFFYLQKGNESYTIEYVVDGEYCLYGYTRYNLSETLKEKFRNALQSLYYDVDSVFAEKNGFNIADFGGGRYIGFKKIKCELYYFLFIKKEAKIEKVMQFKTSVASFINSLSFSRWENIDTDLNVYVQDVKNNVFPLSLVANRVGDKFLEYEIKYVLNLASQEEIDYLNNVDSKEKDRFYLKKTLYDLQDVVVLSAIEQPIRWYRSVRGCKIIIDGVQRKAYFYPSFTQELSKLKVIASNKANFCKITNQLADKIKEIIQNTKP